MSAIAMILGIILGMFTYRTFRNYLNRSASRQSETITSDIFTIRKPTVKTVMNTFLLIVWVSIFAMYKRGILFEQSMLFDAVSVIIALMIFYQIYTCINTRIEVYNNTVTDKRGNRYFFTDLDGYRKIGTSIVVYFQQRPVIKVDHDDIGRDRFVEILSEYGLPEI